MNYFSKKTFSGITAIIPFKSIVAVAFDPNEKEIVIKTCDGVEHIFECPSGDYYQYLKYLEEN